MDSQPKKRVSPLTLVLILIIVLLAGAAVVLAVGKFGGETQPDTENLGDGSTPLIGYEEGVTALDEDSLRKAVEEMYAEAAKGGVPVEYRNDATSTDGKKFDCYIANPAYSDHDVFITIFSDTALSDQLYLSGLIPPGKAMRELNLDHKLDSGKQTVYVVYTQVEEDHATMYQQVVVTMDFTVE